MQKPKKLRPCAAWATRLALTRPEDLSPSEQAALLAHLDKCPVCSAIRLEYRLMDIRICNYPPSEKLRGLSPPQPIPEYEFHRLGLLLQRQGERNRGIMLIVSGLAFLFIVLACLAPLILSHKIGIIVAIIDIVGIVVPMYFLWNGIASILSSLRPVTIGEVKKRRTYSRRIRYEQAHGKRIPEYTGKGRKKTLLIGSGLTVSGGSLLFFALKSIPELTWAYIPLIGGVVCLIESVLLLEALYLAPKQEKDLPAQSLQELSRLLADGELASVKGSWGQDLEEESGI